MFGVALNQNSHPPVQPAPEDTVSCLAWHPSVNFLLATSWDSKIRLWEINEAMASATPKWIDVQPEPLLSCCWSSDGSNIFYGGCDNTITLFNSQSSSKITIGQHNKPVSWIKWLTRHNILMSGGWDNTLKVWDGRQAGPVFVYQLPERLYCGDVKDEVGVFATAERHILIFDLSNAFTLYKQYRSPLKFQSRCCQLFVNKKGFALGSVEGRVAIQNIGDESNDFTFQCHRDKDNNIINSVNDVAFHPTTGILATCGSDGGLCWWNKDDRKLVISYKNLSLPITRCTWNHSGSIFSYSAGYDWTKGTKFKAEFQSLPTNIYISKGTL